MAFGLASGLPSAWTSRTQAGQVAATLSRLGRPGDVVAFCPDQIGPSVNRLVPRAELQGTLEELAGRLARGPTKAIWIAKWLTNRALDVDRATSLHDEAMGQELLSNTLDSTEGIASFVERRPAAFKGW